MTSQLFNSLALPNGSSLPNRIAKAAMEEDMAEYGQVPGKALCELYRRWSTGGARLVISGLDHRSPGKTQYQTSEPPREIR